MVDVGTFLVPLGFKPSNSAMAPVAVVVRIVQLELPDMYTKIVLSSAKAET